MTVLQVRPDELIAILRPEFMGNPGTGGGGLGGWLNKIYLIPDSTDPLTFYEKTDTGLDQANALAAAGDTIYIPPCTLTANHTMVDGVEYWAAARDKTILTGEITIGTAILNNMSITRTANDADVLRAIIGPSSGIGKLYGCNVSVTQSGAGNAADIDIVGAGSVYANDCNFTASSVSGDEYLGIRAQTQTGEIKLWDCQIDAGTKEYSISGETWIWEAPGISANIVKPAFGVSGGTFSAWSTDYSPPADTQALVYRHVRTGSNTNEWSHSDTSPDNGSFVRTVNDDQFNVDKHLYFRRVDYDAGTDAQVLAKYPSAIWEDNDNAAVLGPNQVVRAGWSSGFGIDSTYTVTIYMLDVLRKTVPGTPTWTDPVSPFLFTYSVQGDHDFIIEVEPMEGDLGVWNDIDYKVRHARSLNDGTYEYHWPLSNLDATAVPTANDDSGDGYAVGSHWIDVTHDNVYICVDATLGAAVWSQVGSGGGGGGAAVEYSDDNVSNPPTEPQLITAFGSPADFRSNNKLGHLNDAGLGLNEYLVVSDGSNYWFNTLAKAVSGTPSLGTVTETDIAAPAAGEWYGRANVQELSDGTWVLVYREGTDHAASNDGQIHIRFSDDYGATWTAEDTYLDGNAVSEFPAWPTGAAPADAWDAGIAHLILAPNGTLIIHMQKVDYNLGTFDGLYEMTSTDGGASWSAVSTVTFNSVPGGAAGNLHGDYFVYNSEIYAVGGYSGNDALFKSSDNGATWDYVSDIAASGEAVGEPAMEYIGSNTIIVVFRDNNNTVTKFTKSTDLGATWAALTDITSAVGGVPLGRPMIYTRSHLKGLANWWNDNVLVMCGFELTTPGSSHERRNAVWVSQDAGDTWTGPLYTDTQQYDGGYGDIAYDPLNDKYVHISYVGPDLLSATVKQYKFTINNI